MERLMAEPVSVTIRDAEPGRDDDAVVSLMGTYMPSAHGFRDHRPTARRGSTRGARIVRLDTCRFITAAQGLYRSRGFLGRPPYEGTEIPERLQQHWIFFERPP